MLGAGELCCLSAGLAASLPLAGMAPTETGVSQ